MLFYFNESSENLRGKIKIRNNSGHFEQRRVDPEQEKFIYKMMTNGSYFGETDFFANRGRLSNAQALTDCHLYTLSRTVSRV